jgi:DNA repair protein RecN (Recombination protein N)
MLKELSIKNFAIIDDLSISFSEGLTILSGETGAGKSIIINAVNLILGSRATAKLIRTGAKTAELEAMFQVSPKSRALKTMEDYGFDPSSGLLIRRVIAESNRHKIYINGHIATMQMLNSITDNLASISGQRAHQGLLLEGQHLLILDQFGGLQPLQNKVSSLFQKIVPMIRKLKELKTLKDKQAEQIEFLKFQKKEIEDASITPGEDEELERKRAKLKNSEVLLQCVNASIEGLYDANGAVSEQLYKIQNNLEQASRIDPAISSVTKDIEGVTFKIEDITQGLRSYLNSIEMNEKQLEEVEDRLDFLVRLKRKYGGSLESVAAYLVSIDENLSKIENISGTITETEKELSQCHDKLTALVWELSEKRELAGGKISKKVEKELSSLKMASTRFMVSLKKEASESSNDLYLTTKGKAITQTGIDRATFLIAPNVGEELKPLENIASGGELSRMVLALKAILAGRESVGTVVFDEVDAGIGGSVAEVVGKKLSDLAKFHQVICITHLAQIAKFGKHHFKISKHVSDGRTKTSIKPLSRKKRVDEIARMIGGEKITKAALNHAQEILKERKVG